MTPERWQQVKAVFQQALERDTGERAMWLAQACGSDNALRSEVTLLLDGHAQAGSFIETPAHEVAADFVGAQTSLVGQQLSHYRILALLGKGGMGEVYRARDSKLQREVAIKVLPADFSSDRDRVRRFEREARAASALNHPNILTVHEIGDEGSYFLVTELIEGQTLRQRLASGRVELSEALEVVIQVTTALAAAHAAGIVHRDIKPENVMLRPDGLVKVLDFGLAKLAEPSVFAAQSQASASNQSSTEAGMVMGTARYMSPEQARGLKVDARTDIFSLGVVLYELVAGHPPFEGATMSDVIAAILTAEPAPLAPAVPAELERILKQALAKNADERYPNAQALLADLKKLNKRLEFDAEFERNSSADEPSEAQTLMMKQTTAATPESLATAGSEAQTSSDKLSAKRHWWWMALLSLLLLPAGWFGYRSFAPIDNQIESIAVMPFQNKNSDADSEYLSDGLAESLIYRLSQLSHLKVSPRSSVFRYKGKETDVQKIGQELGVHAVMMGRLVQRGEHLTISVELVDVQDNKLLWGEQYDRKLADLLATQREIATEITNNLKLKLSGADQQGLQKRYTDNNEAYQVFLKGRFHFAKRTKNDLERGIEYFQQAIKLDSNFALAYVGIADSYAMMPSYAFLSPKEANPQATAAARRALELDPTLAEAHAALALSHTNDWNWAEAEREYKRATELNPNVANTHYYYGLLLQRLGKTEEMLRELKRAVELEPLSLIINVNLAAAYLMARQNDLALEQARKTYDLDPNFPIGRAWLSYIYIANGMHTEAIALGEKSLQTDPTNQVYLLSAGYAYAKSGQRRAAEEVIKKTQRQRQTTQYVLSYVVAQIHAALGKWDEAFAELEKAYAARDWTLPRMKVDPVWDSLRDDPRFLDLLRRMGLDK